MSPVKSTIFPIKNQVLLFVSFRDSYLQRGGVWWLSVDGRRCWRWRWGGTEVGGVWCPGMGGGGAGPRVVGVGWMLDGVVQWALRNILRWMLRPVTDPTANHARGLQVARRMSDPSPPISHAETCILEKRTFLFSGTGA